MLLLGRSAYFPMLDNRKMDFEDDEVVVGKAKDSGFLEDDSSLADMFAPAGFDKDLPQDLSEIGKQMEGEDDYGDNELDQGVIEDTSDDHGDAGGGLQDILRDEEPGLDVMRKVHKFTVPILSPEEIARAKQGDEAAGEEVVEIRHKQAGKAADHVEAVEERRATNAQESETSQKEHTEFERIAVPDPGWRCTACEDANQNCSLQSYCSVF